MRNGLCILGALTNLVAISSVRGDESAEVRFSIAKDKLEIHYETPKPRDKCTTFVALETGRGPGSAVVPFAEKIEGSTVFLPFQADRLFILGNDERWKRTWEKWQWSERRDARLEIEFSKDNGVISLPLSKLGPKPKVVVYSKDFSSDVTWGRLVKASDPSVAAGGGDQYVPHYYEVNLQGKKAPVTTVRGRLESDRSRLRIYQLFVRQFGNVNETRKVNGTLAENGVGKFADLSDAALRSIEELGFSHIWLTGVLQQASGTDYSDFGQPAADPDLLKGIAGSPYAIADYFDVCPDYASDPKKRLTEFKALLARVHKHHLKALIDFVPNHVARCYHSDVQPENDFGAKDDRATFFDPKNNFFYLQPNEDGPPLQLPTWRDGAALSPTCQVEGISCDGRFDGELEYGRVTGNNVVSWKPSLDDWYETLKLNYGFDFTDPKKEMREFPNARTPNKPVPNTWEKMDRIIAYWQSLGVDGFRCDMSHMEPPEFWKWLIHRARARSAEVVFLGEAYDNDPAKVPGSDPVISRLNHGRGNVMFDLLDAGFNGVYDDPTYRVLKGIYESGKWANDLDTAVRDPFIFENSLRYAENHDEVRLAAPSQWGGVGMKVGRAVSAILYGLSHGPVMLYNGQEVGEPGAGAEGFGKDDSRTSIFDYWSMPELVKWVNGHKYDGGKLSDEQKELREFYGRLVRLSNEPAFRDGGLFPLNPANRENAHFGRVGEERASGHWCYAFLRYDAATEQRFLVLANLHPTETLRDVRVMFPPETMAFLQLGEPGTKLRFTDRLAREPANFTATVSDLSSAGLEVAEIPPLSARYLEFTPNE